MLSVCSMIPLCAMVFVSNGLLFQFDKTIKIKITMLVIIKTFTQKKIHQHLNTFKLLNINFILKFCIFFKSCEKIYKKIC